MAQKLAQRAPTPAKAKVVPQTGTAKKKATVRVGGPDSTATAEVAVNPPAAQPEITGPDAAQTALADKMDKDRAAGNLDQALRDAAVSVSPSEGPATAPAAENDIKPRTAKEILADPKEREKLLALSEEAAFRQIGRLLAAEATSRGETLTDEQRIQLDEQAVDRYFVIYAEEYLRASDGEVDPKVAQESLFIQKTREARKLLVEEALASGKRADDVGQSEVHRKAFVDYLKARYEITTTLLNLDGTIKNEKALVKELSQRIVDNTKEAQQKPLTKEQLAQVVWQERASLLAQAYHRRGEGLPAFIINDKRWDMTRALVWKTQMQYAEAHSIDDTNSPTFRSMVEQQGLEKYFLEEQKETFWALLLKILQQGLINGVVIGVKELKDQGEALLAGR